jgi:hypothetical protein
VTAVSAADEGDSQRETVDVAVGRRRTCWRRTKAIEIAAKTTGDKGEPAGEEESTGGSDKSRGMTDARRARTSALLRRRESRWRRWVM